MAALRNVEDLNRGDLVMENGNVRAIVDVREPMHPGLTGRCVAVEVRYYRLSEGRWSDRTNVHTVDVGTRWSVDDDVRSRELFGIDAPGVV